MPDTFWDWTGDIHPLVTDQWAGVIVTVASVICGGLIGIERERAQKPAGMRTMILICLGSAIFTQASILIGGGSLSADRGRIAAQVVSGIGFLGAGAIIRERGLIIGVTTGAGIWATAAVGVVLGSGHVAAGLFFSLLIVGTLAAARGIDRVVLGPCRFKKLRITFDTADEKPRFAVQAILDDHQQNGPVEYERMPDGSLAATIRYCSVHRDHRSFVPALVRLPHVTRVAAD